MRETQNAVSDGRRAITLWNRSRFSPSHARSRWVGRKVGVTASHHVRHSSTVAASFIGGSMPSSSSQSRYTPGGMVVKCDQPVPKWNGLCVSRMRASRLRWSATASSAVSNQAMRRSPGART